MPECVEKLKVECVEKVVDRNLGVYLQGIQEERMGSTTFEQARAAAVACMEDLTQWASGPWAKDLPQVAIEAQKRTFLTKRTRPYRVSHHPPLFFCGSQGGPGPRGRIVVG